MSNHIELLNENMLGNQQAYFLSVRNLDKKTLTPRIPKNYFTKNGFEDSTTPRVSFAPSIDKCLMAIPLKERGMELYVHVVDGNVEIKKPTVRQVPDSKITNEIWVVEPVKIKCIGKIQVIDDAEKPGLPFTYGTETAELYEWTWKWVQRYSY